MIPTIDKLLYMIIVAAGFYLSVVSFMVLTASFVWRLTESSVFVIRKHPGLSFAAGLFTIISFLLPFGLWMSMERGALTVLFIVLVTLMFMFFSGLAAFSIIVGEKALELAYYGENSTIRKLLIGATLLFLTFTIPLLGWTLMVLVLVASIGSTALVFMNEISLLVWGKASRAAKRATEKRPYKNGESIKVKLD